MKKVKLYEDYVSENVQEVQADEINAKAASSLLKLAAKQKEDKFQGSYTVDKGNKKLKFNTYSALLTMVSVEDGGFYGPSYGISITGKGELEAFGDNGNKIVGMLNKKSLSGAMQSVKAAAKKAEALHNGK